MLRARQSRREDYAGSWLPEPIVSTEPDGDPEQEALLADSVGLALLVVLENLTPAERLAFVLHDMFAVPFDELAPILARAPAATRRLASRARRRVKALAPAADPDILRQREVVDAFLAASRAGDLEALVEVLDPTSSSASTAEAPGRSRAHQSPARQQSNSSCSRAAPGSHRTPDPRSSTEPPASSSPQARGCAQS
jgi:sigma-70-like protein